MKNKKVSMVITILLFGGWTVYCIITGIMGLGKSKFTPASQYAQKGALCEVDIDFAMEVYTVEHRLNYIIPTGNEHFYFAAAEDSEIPLLIKQTPAWYDENFDEDGVALRPVTVVGEVRRFDSDGKTELRKVATMFSTEGVSISTDVYLSGNYKTLYILRLVSGLLMVAAVVAFVLIIARLESVPKWAGTFATVIGIAALLFMVFVMLCGETV